MKYTDDELRSRINQGLMSEAEMEAIPMSRLRALAETDMADQQNQILAHQKAESTEAAAERANAEQLLAWKNRAPEPVTVETFENLTAQEILDLEREARAKAEADAKPEAILEQRARDLQQEITDLEFVAEQRRNQTGPQLQEAISAEIARQTAETNQSLATQLQWVSQHPEFIRNEHNGNLLRDWVRAQGFQSFTLANLDLALEVNRSKLQLLNSDQLEAQRKMTEAVRTGEARPRRAASSVSARDNISEG